MGAPNRSTEVSRIVANSPAFSPIPGEPMETSDNRKRVMLFRIVNGLNTIDGGQWGVLVKNDRVPPYIPSDIIVWRPTREHFDVLTDVGPMWGGDGVIENPRWEWMEAPVVGPIPTPVPDTGTGEASGGATNTEIRKLLDEVHADNLEIIKQNAELIGAIYTMAAAIKDKGECRFEKFGLEGNTKAFGGRLQLNPR